MKQTTAGTQQNTKDRGLTVLEVSASARLSDSVSRRLTRRLIARLKAARPDVELIQRDLADGIDFVDEAWVAANFTAPESRTESHRATLAASDKLVAELQAADVIVIGAPVYNFGVPAALKAWVDMIARARLTFRYTDNGPEGLLKGKKAIVAIASGGVPVGSQLDFATPWLRQALHLVGIDDVTFIAADGLNTKGEAGIAASEQAMDVLLPACAA